MRSLPLLLVSASVLTLSACIVRHGDRHDDDGPWRGEPGERHTLEDTADTATDSGTDTAIETGADSAVDTGSDADTAVDTGADTADTGTPPAWSLSSECRDAALQLTGGAINVAPTAITPGSSFVLTVQLQNTTANDDLAYPGVLFGSDNASVTSPGADWRYGLFAGMTDDLGTVYTVASDIALPATVTLTATVTRIGCEHGEVATPDGVACPAACTLSYPVTLVSAP